MYAIRSYYGPDSALDESNRPPDGALQDPQEGSPLPARPDSHGESTSATVGLPARKGRRPLYEIDRALGAAPAEAPRPCRLPQTPLVLAPVTPFV